MQRFSRQPPEQPRQRRVRELLERPPSVPEADWREAAAAVFAEAPASVEWLPVLDEGNRPVAVAGRPLVPGTEPRLAGVDRIAGETTVADAARRAVRRPVAERLMPYLRCDSRGRYVGLVRVERLVEELARERGLRAVSALTRSTPR